MIENHRYSAEAFKKLPSTEQAVARLNLINQSAVTIFAKKGYDAASVEDIASASGILKGSLYHYMTGKEDLLYHLVTRINEEGIELSNRVAQTDTPVIVRLFEFATAYTRFNAERAVEVSIYYRSWHQLSAGRYAIVHGQRVLITKFLSGLVREAQEAGLIAAEVNRDLAVNFFFGASNWVYTWFNPEKHDADEVGEAFALQWITSLGIDLAELRS